MDKADRYIVTVEYEVFADSRSNAVRQFFIDNDRFLTVRNAQLAKKPEADPRVYQHEQSYYDEGGEPFEFALPEDDDSDVLFWLPLDTDE